jgi:hypothetical protein
MHVTAVLVVGEFSGVEFVIILKTEKGSIKSKNEINLPKT